MSDKKEYIERRALIAFVREVRKRLPKDSKDFFTRDEMLLNFQQYVDMQPAADVEPVVHAHWVGNLEEIPVANGGRCVMKKVYRCSNCNGVGSPSYRGCPHCFAHMDERSEEE